MFRFLPSIILLVLLSIPVASAAPHDDSVGETSRKWNKSILSICFLEPNSGIDEKSTFYLAYYKNFRPMSQTRKETIRAILQANYPRSLTGISLTGFQDCRIRKGVPNADVVVINDMDVVINGTLMYSWSYGSIGNDPAYRFPSVAINERDARNILDAQERGFAELFAKLIRKSGGSLPSDFRQKTEELVGQTVLNDFRYVVIHEFGHLFGLRHEQMRISRYELDQNYAFCNAAPIAGDINNFESVTNGSYVSLFKTEYDPFSIMNYCRMAMFTFATRARFVCRYGERINKEKLDSTQAEALRTFMKNCDFFEENDFPLGLSVTDQAGLRSLYLNQDSPVDDLDYRRSEKKVKWISVLQNEYDLFSKLRLLPNIDAFVTKGANRRRIVNGIKPIPVPHQPTN